MKKFAILPILLLSSCGFRPLYSEGGASNRSVRGEMSQIFVDRINNRGGQLLRLALQEDLGSDDSSIPQKYTLSVSRNVGIDAVDIHTDNTSGRMRANASAHWRLYTVADQPKLLAEGDASLLDGYTTTFQQYFAQSLNMEALDARISKNLAGQISEQLAAWFNSHVMPAKRNDPVLPKYFDPNAMPSRNGQPMQKAGPDGFPAAATGRTDIGIDDE